MKERLINILKERSTYVGFAGLAIALGLTSEEWEVYAGAAVALFSMVAIVIEDKSE